ncbi:8-oxo-dGTP diphosphatase [Streptococcus pluranimalium]|uniref:NUDIX hydrolase n=1 Tax=Streptococcus pluranimalium TaxID=82348 RepID=UPI002415324C|nr:8-oxo-dGTP diphosphatase [Streptococcus pluranimalium]WFM79082.1 8-oxo-dGTP diphosphatase [Streptococcus pluranimalium]
MTKLATICYIDNGKELLLMHRNKKENDVHEGKWISVGGKLEAGESPEECAVREIFEETHLKVKQMDFKGVITFPNFTPGHDWYTYVFKVTAFEGELISDDESCEGTLEWVPYSKVLEKPTWEGDYQMFKWILEDVPFFSAKFTYQENRLIDQKVTFYQGLNKKELK